LNALLSTKRFFKRLEKKIGTIVDTHFRLLDVKLPSFHKKVAPLVESNLDLAFRNACSIHELRGPCFYKRFQKFFSYS